MNKLLYLIKPLINLIEKIIIKLLLLRFKMVLNLAIIQLKNKDILLYAIISLANIK